MAQEESEQIRLFSPPPGRRRSAAARPSRGSSVSSLLFEPQVAAGDGSPCRRTQEGTCDSPGRVPPQSAACKLAELQARTPERPQQGAVFWPYAWRSQLCTCTGCKVSEHSGTGC